MPLQEEKSPDKQEEDDDDDLDDVLTRKNFGDKVRTIQQICSYHSNYSCCFQDFVKALQKIEEATGLIKIDEILEKMSRHMET